MLKPLANSNGIVNEMEEKRLQFLKYGVTQFPRFIDPANVKVLLDQVLNTRNLCELFLTEGEFEAQAEFIGMNPRAGRNLAEKLDTEFVFGSVEFSNLMRNVLGAKYRVLDYKFVCGIPSNMMPNWVRERLKNRLVNNLGMYIKPKYRDITYFHGIDFHQDIIDYPSKQSDFITCYIYLDEVNLNQAPLHVLLGSHLLGCTSFPHKLERKNEIYVYEDESGNSLDCECLVLSGSAGDLSIWHSATLHGTQPQKDDSCRISLRILLERNQSCAPESWLDECNEKIEGKLSLSETRRDLDEKGRAKLEGNVINQL